MDVADGKRASFMAFCVPTWSTFSLEGADRALLDPD